MNIIDCVQGSDEWYQARLGKVTASCFGHAIAGGQGKTRKQYMIKLIAERMTGEHQMGYSNKFMENGSGTEPQAREYYELLNDCIVQEVGFCEFNENTGASPDGLIGEDGTLEIKCPLASTHIETILADRVPSVYVPQIQGTLWVTGRQWCDFVSYVPQMTNRPYWCKRVFRDEKNINVLKIGIESFIEDMLELMEKLNKSAF